MSQVYKVGDPRVGVDISAEAVKEFQGFADVEACVDAVGMVGGVAEDVVRVKLVDILARLKGKMLAAVVQLARGRNPDKPCAD